ncbi:RHS repeat-associated core domain-containing protein, partial [Algoriphagus ratkowskyi]
VMSTGPIIVQETHYDPWGMEIKELGYQYGDIKVNPYLYNGKEAIDHLGIELYDYGARMYDPVIGRWSVVDPLAEERSWMSPYNFVQNNPLSRIDPDGMLDIRIHGENNSSVTIITDLIDIDVNAGGLVGDLGGNYSLQGDDILSAGLDLVGVLDPTGVADGLNAGLQAKNGDWLGAAISTAGIIPYIGDVAKVGKIGKDLKIINNAIDAVRSGDKVSSTSRAARREAMRDAGIPTSQQPKSQSRNSSGREYTYEVPGKGGGTQTKSVQQQTLDRSHQGQPHWEAGQVKTDNSKVRMNNYGRPKLDNNKSKVNYNN